MDETEEVRTRRGRTPLPRKLLGLVLLVLLACGPVSSTTSYRRGDGFGAGVQAFFQDVAYTMEGIPVIGPLFGGILDGLAPGDHWCVGLGFIVLFLAIVAGIFRTRRRRR